MGGGEQSGSSPAMDAFQQYQQQQQYNQLGQTLSKSFQGIGQSVAQPTAMPQPFGQQAQQISPLQTGSYGQGLGAAATGPLFAQQGMGGSGGINQQQLAQILQLLGYGG